MPLLLLSQGTRVQTHTCAHSPQPWGKVGVVSPPCCFRPAQLTTAKEPRAALRKPNCSSGPESSQRPAQAREVVGTFGEASPRPPRQRCSEPRGRPPHRVSSKVSHEKPAQWPRLEVGLGCYAQAHFLGQHLL